MARWGMVFDLKRCIGCNACAIACKQENNLPDSVFLTKTLSEEVGEYPKVRRLYIPTLCNHCDAAPCEEICPTGATYTRRDGIVMVDQTKCIGCGSCIVACPYDARTMIGKAQLERGLFGNGELTPYEEQGIAGFIAGTMVKCTFCHERLDRGLEPACVITCPTGARLLGDLDDPDSKISQLIEGRGGRPPMPEKNTKPKVYYIS